MASIKLNTGLKVYDIEDENGNIRGQISFNPSDMNFPSRAKVFINNVTEYLDNLEVKESEEIDQEEMYSIMEEIDNKIKSELNELFADNNCSEIVFGKQNCLNTLNGITFIERFISSVMPVIEKDYKEESKKSEKRISKYTSQVK